MTQLFYGAQHYLAVLADLLRLRPGGAGIVRHGGFDLGMFWIWAASLVVGVPLRVANQRGDDAADEQLPAVLPRVPGAGRRPWQVAVVDPLVVTVVALAVQPLILVVHWIRSGTAIGSWEDTVTACLAYAAVYVVVVELCLWLLGLALARTQWLPDVLREIFYRVGPPMLLGLEVWLALVWCSALAAAHGTSVWFVLVPVVVHQVLVHAAER